MAIQVRCPKCRTRNAVLRESLHRAETPSELSHLQRLVNEFLKLIRAERTSLGLPDRYYPAH